MCLPRGVLTLASAQYLTENCLRDICFFDACARHKRLKDSGTKIMCRGVGECSTEAAFGGPCRRGDNYVCH
jgi:hypothetical protein